MCIRHHLQSQYFIIYQTALVLWSYCLFSPNVQHCLIELYVWGLAAIWFHCSVFSVRRKRGWCNQSANTVNAARIAPNPWLPTPNCWKLQLPVGNCQLICNLHCLHTYVYFYMWVEMLKKSKALNSNILVDYSTWAMLIPVLRHMFSRGFLT